jgi:hypothetical protein
MTKRKRRAVRAIASIATRAWRQMLAKSQQKRSMSSVDSFRSPCKLLAGIGCHARGATDAIALTALVVNKDGGGRQATAGVQALLVFALTESLQKGYHEVGGVPVQVVGSQYLVQDLPPVTVTNPPGAELVEFEEEIVAQGTIPSVMVQDIQWVREEDQELVISSQVG